MKEPLIPDESVAVSVKNLYKSFRLPIDKHDGAKQYLLNLLQGKRSSGYEIQEVLRGISFEIKKGEFFGIVGRNGSGKSTLLKTLAGIYNPDTGSVDHSGNLVPFIELGVGFNPELTGRENIFLNGALLGFSRKEMIAMYDEIVEFAELERFMDQKLKNYSSGMQVRLAFSIAIKAQGDILLLDEVLAVGDAAFQQKCFDYFEELKRGDKTVILVTHDMGAVERFCDRALILESGKIRSIGTPNSIADIYREENINHHALAPSSPAENGNQGGHKQKIQMSLDDLGDSVLVEFSTDVDYPAEDIYVGLTIFRDGYNIGEINSMTSDMGQNGINYTIDKTIFNPGAYEVSAGLFLKSNRETIAIVEGRKVFMVRGLDRSRGSGVKLSNSWQVPIVDDGRKA